MAEAAAKTATKTARPSPINGNVLPVGAHPGNTGGKKGRSGRKPGPFKDLLKRLRESPELAQSLEKAIGDPDSKAFPAALKLLSEYDEDKPAERKQLEGEVTVRVIRDE